MSRRHRPPGPRTLNTGLALALLVLALFWGLVGLFLTAFNGSAR